MVESFPDFISKPQSTGPRSSGNPKKEKYKEKALRQKHLVKMNDNHRGTENLQSI